MATRPRHTRRILRGTFLVMVGLFLFALLAGVTMFFVGRSSWGRQRILSIVLPVAEKSLAGQLRIGALDGDFTHMLVLRDVELHDVEGKLAVRLPYVGLRYNLLALLGRTLQLTAVDLKHAEVHARVMKDGRLNLAALTKPDDSPPSTGPLPIRILIGGVDAELFADFDGGSSGGPIAQAAAKVHLRASLHLRPDRQLSFDVDGLDVESSAPLAAKLGLQGKVAMSLLDVAKSLSLSDVTLTLSTDGAEVTRLAPAAALHGPLALDLKLDGSLAALETKLKLALPKGHAQLQAKLGVLDDKLPWQIALSLEAIDPSALRTGLPPSQIDLALRGTGSGASGRVELQNLSVRTEKNALQLAGTVEAPLAPAVWIDPLGAQTDLALKLDARDLSELSRLGSGAPPLAGSIDGNVEVHLKQRALRLTTHLRGSGLRAPGVELGRLQLDIATTDLAGKLQLVAENLAAGGQQLARIALTAEGDRRLVRLGLDGEGPESVKLKLALQARPELSNGSGPLELQGAKLVGLAAELTELLLQRGTAKLSITQPAQIRLTQLTQSPIAELGGLSIALGALKLRVDGRYETQEQKLRATVDASNVDVQELARIATGNANLPASQLALHLELAGSVPAPTGNLRLSGHVEPLTGLLPWRVQPEIAATFADRRVRGELSLRAETTPPESNSPTVKARFDAPLGTVGAIDLKLDVQSALESLRPLLPPALKDLSGVLAVNMIVGGTLRQPQAEIKIALPRWQLAPVRGTQTTLNINYKPQQLGAQLGSQILSVDGKPLLHAALDAQAPLRLGIDVSANQVMEQLQNGAGSVHLALRELALPQIITVAQGAAKKSPLSAGSAELDVQVRGPLLRPTMTARVDARGLRAVVGSGLPEAPIDVALKANYAADDLGLTLGVELDGKPLVRGQAGTTVRLAELMQKGAAIVDTLPLRAQVDVLPTQLPPGLPVRGSIKAHAEVHGTPKLPLLTADATATGLLVGEWPVGDMTLHAAVDAQRMINAQARIAQKGSNAGTLSLDASVPLPFEMTAAALKVLLQARDFRIDYQAMKGERAAVRLVRGTLDSNLTVQGGSPQPVVLGSLSLREGQVSTAVLPQLLRDIAIEIRAQEDGSIRLAQLSARAGQGRVRAEGGVKLSKGALRSVELTTKIDNFPVAAGSIGLWVDTRVVVTGSAPDDTLRVKVSLPYGTVRLPKLSSGSDSDLQALGPLEDVRYIDAAARAAAAEIEEAAERRRAGAEKSDNKAPPLLPPRTLITVELPPAFVVSGPEVKTNFQGHIDAELTQRQPAGPILTGEIRTLGGWVEILSRRYQLERAQVSMSGEVPPNPLLNVVLSRKIDDATIYIQVSGTARKPVITFRSDPAIYDQAQVIGMVLSGSRGGTIQQQALGALSGLLIGKLKDTLGKAVPVDVIKFDVGGNDASGANQSSLEVGKYLRDNLYLSYTHRFGNPSTILRRLNNDQVGLEWYFLPDYQINLMGGDQGVGALNLYWTKRF